MHPRFPGPRRQGSFAESWQASARARTWSDFSRVEGDEGEKKIEVGTVPKSSKTHRLGPEFDCTWNRVHPSPSLFASSKKQTDRGINFPRYSWSYRHAGRTSVPRIDKVRAVRVAPVLMSRTGRNDYCSVKLKEKVTGKRSRWEEREYYSDDNLKARDWMGSKRWLRACPFSGFAEREIMETSDPAQVTYLTYSPPRGRIHRFPQTF